MVTLILECGCVPQNPETKFGDVEWCVAHGYKRALHQFIETAPDENPAPVETPQSIAATCPQCGTQFPVMLPAGAPT